MKKHNDYVRISSGLKPKKLCIGEKGIRLMEMKRLGFEVPDGVLLSVEFLRRLIHALDMDSDIETATKKESRGDKNIDDFVLQIFKEKDLRKDFKESLEHEIQSIEGYYDGMLFAVRSATLGEDDKQSSFAGQYATILGVKFEDIWEGIYACYASWWTDRAVSYRRRNTVVPRKPQISIILQRQLIPDCSGVLFTKHPVTGADTMFVEAVTGIGEKLVSGQVTPARWEIDPRSGEVISFSPDKERTMFSSDMEYLDDLISIGRKLEDAYLPGLDIEWAVEKGKLFLVQSRPITGHATQSTVQNITKDIYSRSIVEDLWSDRMTNMTSSIVFDELSELYTFKIPLRRLGLNDLADIKAIQVIDGHGYIHSRAVSELLGFLPHTLRFREIQRVFPPSIRNHVMETPFEISRVLKIIHRIPLLFSDPAVFPCFTAYLLRKHLKKIDRELNMVDSNVYHNRDLAFYHLELERLLILLAKLQIRNQWGYGNAALSTWLFHHFATRHVGRSEEWFLNRMRNIPNNVTMQSQKELREIRDACDGRLVKDVFALQDKDEAWETLQSRYNDHKVTGMLNKFISKYGYRSSNRDFLHPRWDEKPGLVLDLLSLSLGSTPPEEIPQLGSVGGGTNETKIGDIWTAPILWLLTHMTKKFLALREDLRFGLDKVLYRIRKLLLAINSSGHFTKLNDIESGIFFLELNELRSLLLQEKNVDVLYPILKERAKSYKTEEKRSPPFYVMFDGERTINMMEDSGDKVTFQGVAASSGIAEGQAKIIHNDTEFHTLKIGDILIAYNTDPGWTPLFVTAAGVAVEMGGILNHCAIVAREFGIPAIVGIEGITNKIKNGQKVRINGNMGTLEILG